MRSNPMNIEIVMHDAEEGWRECRAPNKNEKKIINKINIFKFIIYWKLCIRKAKVAVDAFSVLKTN